MLFVTQAAVSQVQAQNHAQSQSKDAISYAKSKLPQVMGSGAKDFEGSTWKLNKRYCVASLSAEDMANPTRVYDLAGYYQTWTFENGKQSFEIHNAAKDNSRCVTRIDGTYGYVEIPQGSGVDGVLGTTTERRRRLDCPTTYLGPSLGLIHLLTWSDETRSRYHDATLAGSINNTVCPSTTDYLITDWDKYQDLPL